MVDDNGVYVFRFWYMSKPLSKINEKLENVYGGMLGITYTNKMVQKSELKVINDKLKEIGI